MKKIGMITMHNVANFGAVLQTYALKSTLEKSCYEVEIINYLPWYRRGIRKYFPVMDGNPLIKFMRCMKWLPRRVFWQKSYSDFVKTEIKDVSKVYRSPEELEANPPMYDIYITGSDQVWNPGSTCGLDKAYFLTFAQSSKIKLSYSASISEFTLTSSQVNNINDWLNDYDGISVREDTAQRLLSENGIENVVQVLDPTLLLSRKEWSSFASRSMIKTSEKYVLFLF